MTREVFRDALVYLPAKVVPALAGIAAIPILTNLLSPEIYGQYLFALTVLTLISTFCTSWLSSVTVRFGNVFDSKLLHNKLKNILFIAIIAAILIWAVVSEALPQTSNQLRLLIAGTFWLITQGFFDYYSVWLRVSNMPLWFSIIISWRSVGGLVVATIVLLSYSKEAASVFFSFAVVMFVGLIFMLAKTINVQPINLKNNKVAFDYRSIFGYGIPVALTSFTIASLSYADRLMINWIMGFESVAIYGANYDIAEKTIFFVNSMLLLSSSIIGVRIYENNGEQKGYEFLSKLMRLYLIFTPPLVLMLALLHKEIASLLLPPAYQSGAVVLPIIAFSGLFIGILHRYSLALSFHKRTDIIMLCSVGALLVNLTACYFMIPLYDLIGAALSTFIAYFAWLVFVRIASNKYFNISFPWWTFLRVSLALLFVSIIAVIINLASNFQEISSIFINCLVVIIFYPSALLISGEINRAEINAIFSLLKIRIKLKL